MYETRKEMIYGTWSTKALTALRDDLNRMLKERETEVGPAFHRSKDAATCEKPPAICEGFVGDGPCSLCAAPRKP